MGKERWVKGESREGKGSFTHTGRKYRKCPIGKTSSNVTVNFELIYCLGGHERESVCVLQVNVQLPVYVE